MRTGKVSRKTKETDITIQLDLDKSGGSKIETGIPFFNHMLDSLSRHSGISLQLNAKGDIEIDFHHTIEDTGITLGEALAQAVGDKKGINRFADATVPLDEALARVVIDISGRPFLHFGVDFSRSDDGSNVNPFLFEEFFRGLVNSAGMTLHIDLIRGNNSHHCIEAVFKAFARALKSAVAITGTDIPSTKGSL
jgi:imidazoleglycerol-phosphate dehydratase